MIKKTFEILLISLILGFLLIVQSAWATMTSTNYDIWLDTLSSGGGSASSTNYTINGGASSRTGASASSTNFQEFVGFTGIDEEPTVGFNVQTVSLNFGELSDVSPSYSTHTFSAFTNANEGYTIKVYGTPLNSVDYTLTEIGATSAQSSPGTEQFGLNLVANTLPVAGTDPSGGIGAASANYNTVNYFAFTDGAVIAQAASYSFQTDFTVSVLVNIAEDTPSGIYSTTLTYEFIPVF